MGEGEEWGREGISYLGATFCLLDLMPHPPCMSSHAHFKCPSWCYTIRCNTSLPRLVIRVEKLGTLLDLCLANRQGHLNIW